MLKGSCRLRGLGHITVSPQVVSVLVHHFSVKSNPQADLSSMSPHYAVVRSGNIVFGGHTLCNTNQAKRINGEYCKGARTQLLKYCLQVCKFTLSRTTNPPPVPFMLVILSFISPPLPLTVLTKMVCFPEV